MLHAVPLRAAIAGGSGIYVPFIPAPIPYWVLALLVTIAFLRPRAVLKSAPWAMHLNY